MRSSPAILLITALSLAFAASLALAPMPAPAPGAAPDWSTRLTALTPARPIDYLTLGEEVADAATTAEERELARHLFGLAGALAPTELGRSSALAQASLTQDPRQRRTLHALASLLNASDDAGGTNEVGRVRPAPQHAVALSEAFSQLRRGQGPRALSLLKTAEVAGLLEEYGPRLPGGSERFREDCKIYKGGLRPSYPDSQRLTMLEIEKALLGAAVLATERPSTSWSSALVETGGAPLLEVDTAKLDVAFGVDPGRPLWRTGQWERVAERGAGTP